MSLSPQQLKQNQDEFEDILRSTTTLDEVPEELYTFLKQSDFYRAPASTQYHESYEGGLVQHSLDVYEQLLHLNYIKILGLPESSIAKTALLHDACKAEFYKRARRSRPLEDGRWVRVETYEVCDQLPLGHGEKSVIVLLQHGVKLTDEEALAIRWHMGSYTMGATDYIGAQTLSNAMGKSKLIVALQLADMMATWL